MKLNCPGKKRYTMPGDWVSVVIGILMALILHKKQKLLQFSRLIKLL